MSGNAVLEALMDLSTCCSNTPNIEAVKAAIAALEKALSPFKDSTGISSAMDHIAAILKTLPENSEEHEALAQLQSQLDTHLGDLVRKELGQTEDESSEENNTNGFSPDDFDAEFPDT